MIAVSPFAKPGFVDHTYGDHASILKLIEANWGLAATFNAKPRQSPKSAHLSGATVFPGQQPSHRQSDKHVRFPRNGELVWGQWWRSAGEPDGCAGVGSGGSADK